MDDKPIICSRKKCSRRGYESELTKVRNEKYTGIKVFDLVFPKCGCDSYYLMTPRQVALWEKRKAQGAAS